MSHPLIARCLNRKNARTPSPSHWVNGEQRVGFTLVEVLVVIGIVAVLVALLLPALAKVRSASFQVKCASNLRQMGVGFTQYAIDNKGRLPFGYARYADSSPSNPFHARYRIWPEMIAQFCGFENPTNVYGYGADGWLTPTSGRPFGIFDCPASIALMTMNNTSSTWTAGLYPISPAAYAANIFICPSWDYAGTRYFPRRVSELRDPAQIYLAMDAQYYNGRADLCPYFGVVPQFLIDTRNIISPAGPGMDVPAEENQGIAAFRHTQNLNVLFCDGHVSPVGRHELVFGATFPSHLPGGTPWPNEPGAEYYCSGNMPWNSDNFGKNFNPGVPALAP